MSPMEYHMNKIETNKNLEDLKHKLVALDGIMQEGFKRIFFHDTEDPISERPKEAQPLHLR